MEWLHTTANGVRLSLYIQPGAKQTAVVGLFDSALKLKLAAPPTDGKANRCLISYLATTLAVPRSAIRIVQGETHRRKCVEISGVSESDVQQALHIPIR